jgi:hypothetical protein
MQRTSRPLIRPRGAKVLARPAEGLAVAIGLPAVEDLHRIAGAHEHVAKAL